MVEYEGRNWRGGILPTNRYENFFIAGSFVLSPVLLRNKTSRQLTVAVVRMGLALDDCWDFGMPREQLSGCFVDNEEFRVRVDREMLDAYNHKKDQLFETTNSIQNPQQRRLIRVNLQRFEQGVMGVEGLAMAAPYRQEYWTPAMVDIYRSTDAIVWGAMFSALKPKSKLMLPNLSDVVDSCEEDPAAGLSRLHINYSTHLLLEGQEGRAALSLASQMMYVQIAMDRRDHKINDAYRSPAFGIFDEGESWLQRRGLWHLDKSRQIHGIPSLSRSIATLFPPIYKKLTSFQDWRDIEGWKMNY